MIDSLLKKHKRPFLRWWLLISLIIITFAGLYSMGILTDIYSVDITKLSFLIVGLLAAMSIKCGYDTYALTSAKITSEADMVSSAFLKLQYFNFSSEVDRLVTLSGIKHGETQR